MTTQSATNQVQVHMIPVRYNKLHNYSLLVNL